VRGAVGNAGSEPHTTIFHVCSTDEPTYAKPRTERCEMVDDGGIVVGRFEIV